MKFRVLFKTPDAVYYAAQREADTRQERAELITATEPFTDGENITIEFDTEAGTATVLRRK